MANTKDYIVTKKGCCLKGIKEEEVGAKVKLTDEKAKAMSGKVELMKGYQKSGPSEQELIKANAKLLKRVEELKGLERSSEELDKLKSEGEILEAKGKELASENANLLKSLSKSSEDMEKLRSDCDTLEAGLKELEDKNTKLEKQSEELTAQLDEATKPTKPTKKGK